MTCRRRLDQVRKQIAQATEERDQLDAELPRSGGPLASRLHAADQELAALEALVPLEAERRTVAQGAVSADARLTPCERRTCKPPDACGRVPCRKLACRKICVLARCSNWRGKMSKWSNSAAAVPAATKSCSNASAICKACTCRVTQLIEAAGEKPEEQIDGRTRAPASGSLACARRTRQTPRCHSRPATRTAPRTGEVAQRHSQIASPPAGAVTRSRMCQRRRIRSAAGATRRGRQAARAKRNRSLPTSPLRFCCKPRKKKFCRCWKSSTLRC